MENTNTSKLKRLLIMRSNQLIIYYSNLLLYRPKSTKIQIKNMDSEGQTMLISLDMFDPLFTEFEHKIAIYAPFWIPIIYPLCVGMYALLK